MTVIIVLLSILLAVIILWMILIPLFFIRLLYGSDIKGFAKSEKLVDPVTPEQQLRYKEKYGGE